MRKNITLNRPVFTQQTFDSTRLTVLTSLFHHFPDEGTFDLVVRRRSNVVARTNICVEGKDCQTQLNLDLAHLDPSEGGYRLNVGGVLGFFVSEGTGEYTVTITHTGEREKRVLLNNTEAVPQGGVFAVTLVRPGTYQMKTNKGRSTGKIHLRLPNEDNEKARYRTEQGVTVDVDPKGQFSPNEVNLYTGQSVAFICKAPVQVQVAFGEEEDDVKPPIDRKTKHTRRPKPRPTPENKPPRTRGKGRKG